AGTPVRVVSFGSAVGVVTKDAGRLAFHSFAPTDDRDGDGAVNDLDAFPDDPAASLDADGDGAPDAWNPGKGPADSTTGLVALDAFPNDAACQRPDQALASDPTRCDVAGAVPDYAPDADTISIDADGVVYLLAPSERRIFRWSHATH